MTDGCRKLCNEELNYFALFTTYFQSEQMKAEQSIGARNRRAIHRKILVMKSAGKGNTVGNLAKRKILSRMVSKTGVR